MDISTILIVLSIIGISFLIFYSLSLLSRFIIFPASFSYWRHWHQFSLETEICHSFTNHLHEIRYAIQLLEKPSNLSHLKRNHRQLQESLEIFKVLLSSYTQLENKHLNKRQKTFKSILSSVILKLNETKLTFPNHSEDLFSALQHSNDLDWNHGCVESSPLNKLRQSLEELENFALKIADFKFFQKVLKEGVFSNLTTLRFILESSAKCEQFWVKSDGVEIDCFLVKSFEKSGNQGVMIYCSGSDGLYEYAFYRNIWVEFYVSRGADFCMFNYRGHGRSKGSPSSSSMLKDIKSIYQFLRENKGYRKIGVHGEDIGAVPACYLSKNCEVSFLFADKAYSSLSASFQTYLPVPTQLFKCMSGWSDETLNNYLSTTCYKVLSCDINNRKNSENSSLKAGISKKKNSYQIENKNLAQLLGSLKNLSSFLGSLRVAEKASLDFSQDLATQKDLGCVDQLRLREICLKVLNCAEIDAGGVLLTAVRDLKGLEIWVKVLQIWGSFLPIGSCVTGREKARTRLKESIFVLNDLFKENEFIANSGVMAICRETRVITEGMMRVLKSLENFYMTDTEEISAREDEETGNKETGFLLPVGSGHDGKYSEKEKGMLLQHLKLAKFLN